VSRPPDPLDRDFPLGDGVADTRVTASCPYCGAGADLTVDPGSGAVQEYVEDCAICCRPWMVRLVFDREGRARVTLATEDEGW